MAPKRKTITVHAEYISEENDTVQFRLLEITKEFSSSDSAGVYTSEVNFLNYSAKKTVDELTDHKVREWITETTLPNGIVAIVWWGWGQRGIMAYLKADGRKYSRRVH